MNYLLFTPQLNHLCILVFESCKTKSGIVVRNDSSTTKLKTGFV